jgi:Uma2 family endonuclease
MTALPAATAPPLTADQFAALPEDPDARYELQEGAIVMAAQPVPDHQDCLGEIYAQLRHQVPSSYRVLLEVDVDLELTPPDHSGTVRGPDLVVVHHDAFLRVRKEGGLLRARDVVLAVEIHSVTTRRTDTVIKHTEYADAGIDHYWMVDLLDGPSLTACHRAGEFGYVDADPVRDAFTTDFPFRARIELARSR